MNLHQQAAKSGAVQLAGRLEEKLPVLSVPLLPGDGEIPLDLQAVFDRTYDAGPYRRRVRYDDWSVIVPPLAGDKMAWAKETVEGLGGKV